MSEIPKDSQELSTPDQAQTIADLISGLETPHEEYPDIINSYRTFVDTLPEAVMSRFPLPIVGGDPRYPVFFRIFDDADELQKTTNERPDQSNFRWANAADNEVTTPGFYDLTAEFDMYREDPEIFPYQKYQQTAKITIRQHLPFRELPVELATQLEYTIWVDEAGAKFIQREVYPRVEPTLEGQMIEEERHRQWNLEVDLDMMEKGEDSRWHALFKIAENDFQSPEIAEMYTSPPPENDEDDVIEIAREAQAEMLAERMDGKGVVSAQEAAELIQLLEQFKAAA